MSEALGVTAIVVGVALLVALRAWTWIRRERLLREAGMLLRAPRGSAEAPPEPPVD